MKRSTLFSLQPSQKWRLKKIWVVFFQHHPFFATKAWFKASNKVVSIKSPPSSLQTQVGAWFFSCRSTSRQLLCDFEGLDSRDGPEIWRVPSCQHLLHHLWTKSQIDLWQESVEKGGVRGCDKPTSWPKRGRLCEKMLPTKKTFNSDHGRKLQKRWEAHFPQNQRVNFKPCHDWQGELCVLDFGMMSEMPKDARLAATWQMDGGQTGPVMLTPLLPGFY